MNIVPGQKYQKVGGELSASTLTSLKVSASTFKVLMEGKTLPLRGYLINGNNYYSIADIAESVGFEAGWDNATRTVSITTPDPDPEQPGNNGGSNGSDNTPTPTPKPTPAPTPTPVFTTGVYEVNVSSTLTVRSGPGTSYSSVGQLSKSDKVVVDSLSNGWAHLMDTSKGTGRYVSANYLTRVRGYSASEGEPNDPVEPPRTSQIDGKMTVIIDPGHGGSDVGATSLDGTYDEKHINLTVAKYLQSYLKSAGVNVIMVRDTLEDGSDLARQGHGALSGHRRPVLQHPPQRRKHRRPRCGSVGAGRG